MNENLSEMNESNESASMSAEPLPATKTQRLGKYMLETLKEMYQSIRYPKFKFAISGVIITVVLILVSIWFLLHRGVNPGADQVIDISKMNLIGILISLIIASFVIYLWFLLGLGITPKAAHYLVDNKLLKLVFTRGNVHYLEFVPVEKRKIAIPHILNKYIALLIAWVSVSAFLLNVIAGFIADGDPTGILNPTGSLAILAFLLRGIIIFILVPLVFTLIYPLGWMLVDAKLKGYSSVTKLNWLVGTKVSNLTGGLITLASLFALGADAIFSSDIIARAQLMAELVFFCIINISLTVVLIAIFYNIFFHGKFYQMITESIEVGFGITSVTLTDELGKALPEPELEPEPEVEPEPESKFETEPEPEPEPKPEFEPEQSFESEEE